ncbi:MAG: hypothetical protein A4E60_03235 [Syntrophorhabdus sp. PtaB.Bin047]|nr:MAG: hypothetical protein A4E60_03235 [Syntrophorhabdus sp. PtaB.Bin047]
MSKAKPRIDERQMGLWEYLKPAAPPAPGSMDIGVRIRQTISQAIKNSGKERIDICAEMYKLTGKEVPKSSLDSWSAESRDLSNDGIDNNGNKRWGMPGELFPAFCEVTGDWELLFIIAEAGHYKAMKGREVIHAKMGQLKERIAKDQMELKDLEKALMKVKDDRK